MPTRVLITDRSDQADLDRVRRAADGLEVDTAQTLEEAIRMAKDAEVIQAGRWSDELWKSAPKLKWVQSGGAGVERFLTPEFVASPVVLTNAQGIYAVPIADHVMAFALHFVRCFGGLVRKQGRREWADWGEFALDELAGKTLGIVGFGGIGSEVAKRAKAFDMRVIATRRRAERPAQFAEEVRGADELPWLLRESDIVAVCAALTSNTRHLIGAEQLSLMKPTAYLINIARGGIIDEGALVDALNAGRIAGAGLDVFEQEPLPAESPLWEMANVMITPHNAGDSPRSHARFMELFSENLRRYIGGEALLNVVDKQAGY